MKKLAALTLFVMAVACSQTKPTKVSDIDQERLKRTEAQLQSLQMRYQSEASVIIKEHEDIVTKYCTAAGLTMGPGGNCQVNSQTGEVSKAVAPGQNPAAPGKK